MCSSLSSQSPRFRNQLNDNVPGPGAYNIIRDAVKPSVMMLHAAAPNEAAHIEGDDFTRRARRTAETRARTRARVTARALEKDGNQALRRPASPFGTSTSRARKFGSSSPRAWSKQTHRSSSPTSGTSAHPLVERRRSNTKYNSKLGNGTKPGPGSYDISYVQSSRTAHVPAVRLGNGIIQSSEQSAGRRSHIAEHMRGHEDANVPGPGSYDVAKAYQVVRDGGKNPWISKSERDRSKSARSAATA